MRVLSGADCMEGGLPATLFSVASAMVAHACSRVCHSLLCARCDSPAEMAARCSIVVTMLSDDAALRQVFDNFILAKPKPGTIFVDSSTVYPETTQVRQSPDSAARSQNPVATAAASALWNYPRRTLMKSTPVRRGPGRIVLLKSYLMRAKACTHLTPVPRLITPASHPHVITVPHACPVSNVLPGRQHPCQPRAGLGNRPV
jgi:NAD binding domain of 6-phosphogluconate dehydrogenase